MWYSENSLLPAAGAENFLSPIKLKIVQKPLSQTTLKPSLESGLAAAMRRALDRARTLHRWT
jgi:hypothetical protein